MAIAHQGSSPPSGGGDPGGPALSRDRPERALLALRRGSWISSEQVQAVQCRFLLEATVEAAAEVGYGRISARDVIRRARVSGKTFYDVFPDLDACYLVALGLGFERIAEAASVGAAAVQGAPWEEQVRGGLVEIVALLEAQPALARMCLEQVARGPEAIVAAHRTPVERMARRLRAGVVRSGPRREVADRVARGLVHGAAAALRDGHDGGAAPRAEVVGDVLSLVCGPFVGDAAVRRLRARPAPPPVRDWRAAGIALPEPAGPGGAPAWRGAQERILTYVSGRPGASNVEVGAHMQSNESTTSRRLARLARDGLLVAERVGGRNRWFVTDAGRSALGPDLAPALRMVP